MKSQGPKYDLEHWYLKKVKTFYKDLAKVDASACTYGQFRRGRKLCPLVALAVKKGFKVPTGRSPGWVKRMFEFLMETYKVEYALLRSVLTSWDYSIKWGGLSKPEALTVLTSACERTQ